MQLDGKEHGHSFRPKPVAVLCLDDLHSRKPPLAYGGSSWESQHQIKEDLEVAAFLTIQQPDLFPGHLSEVLVTEIEI